MIENIKTFRTLVEDAELLDDEYELAGSYVWKPYGVELRQRFLELVESEVEHKGYEKYDFPTLIPESYMEPQKEYVTSFEDVVCWITKFGTRDLSKPLYLRPTGETQIYPMASDWIRSYRDLPLSIYQTNRIFRPVSEGTPLLKAQGVKMTEGHGFFKNEKTALNGQIKAVNLIRSIHKKLGLCGLVLKRPLWGNKPVAERNISIDVPLPTGKTRMTAGTYFQNELYSNAYDISYDTPDGNQQSVRQITWGLSTSLLGIYLMLSGDERGLRLLPILAPVQVVFIPIKNNRDEIEMCETLSEETDLRTKIDETDRNIGEKFQSWEQKGVPIRIEIGPDEVDTDTITVFRRDNSSETTIEAEVSSIESLIKKVDKGIRDDIEKFLQSRINEVDAPKEIDSNLSAGLVSKLPFCGDEECGQSLETDRPGELLGILFGEQNESTKPCLICGELTKRVGLYSRRM